MRQVIEVCKLGRAKHRSHNGLETHPASLAQRSRFPTVQQVFDRKFSHPFI